MVAAGSALMSMNNRPELVDIDQYCRLLGTTRWRDLHKEPERATQS